MRVSVLRVVGAVAVVGVMLAGCGGASSPKSSPGAQSQTRIFAAHNGEIEIPAKPQRVVAFSYGVEALMIAGAPLVGVNYQPPEVLDRIGSDEVRERYESLSLINPAGTVANSGLQLDYEKIASLKPDLIIVGVPKPSMPKVNGDMLQTIAPTVFVGPDKPVAWKEVGERATDAAGVPDAFEKQRTEYDQLAAEITQRHNAKIKGWTYAATGGVYKPSTVTREYNNSWITNIPNDIGIDFPGGSKDSSGFAESLSLERIGEFSDSEVIIVQASGDGSAEYPEFERDVAQTRAWRSLPAVKAGRVLYVPYLDSYDYLSAIRALKALDAKLTELPPPS